MAVWRTKAYSLFDLKPGEYSFASGKRDLFANLIEWARLALRDDDALGLSRIVQYVTWAAAQNSDDLASVVDLSFFLPVFRDPVLCAKLQPHLPGQLFAEKWHLLMEQPA